MNSVKFIGMDVHKKTITIAIADEGRQQQHRIYGSIANELEALDKFCRKMVSTSTRLPFVYEAGPCGYGSYRHLTQRGYDCIVAAPSMIPKKSGGRIKNDPRDASMLARLHRAGELTAVYVPDAQDEAIRDLTRAREDAVSATRKAKQQLLAFLLGNMLTFPVRSKWSEVFFNWLADIAIPYPAQQVALREYIDTVQESLNRDRVYARLLLEIRSFLMFFESGAYRIIQDYGKTILDIIQEGVYSGEIRKDIAPEHARQVVLGAIEHLCMPLVISRHEFYTDDITNEA